MTNPEHWTTRQNRSNPSHTDILANGRHIAIVRGTPEQVRLILFAPRLMECLCRLMPWVARLISQAGHRNAANPAAAEEALCAADEVLEEFLE